MQSALIILQNDCLLISKLARKTAAIGFNVRHRVSGFGHASAKLAAKMEDVQKSQREGREATIERLERIAHLMDTAVSIPGTRIRVGWDSLIGLLPGVGDFLSSAPLLYYLWVAHRFKFGPKTWLRLIVNQGIDFLVGSVPLVGDLFDVGFKSNKRNADLLIDKLRE